MTELVSTYNIILLVLGLLVVILGYTTINLLFKNEKAEDIILSQDNIINQFLTVVNKSNDRLNKIDAKGSFKSDDEIGWFFNQILQIQNDLSRFLNQ